MEQQNQQPAKSSTSSAVGLWHVPESDTVNYVIKIIDSHETMLN